MRRVLTWLDDSFEDRAGRSDVNVVKVEADDGHCERLVVKSAKKSLSGLEVVSQAHSAGWLMVECWTRNGSFIASGIATETATAGSDRKEGESRCCRFSSDQYPGICDKSMLASEI